MSRERELCRPRLRRIVERADGANSVDHEQAQVAAVDTGDVVRFAIGVERSVCAKRQAHGMRTDPRGSMRRDTGNRYFLACCCSTGRVAESGDAEVPGQVRSNPTLKGVTKREA